MVSGSGNFPIIINNGIRFHANLDILGAQTLGVKIEILTSFLLVAILAGYPLYSQDKKAGPVIIGHGKVWKVENADIKVDPEKKYKVVFDIMDSPEDKDALNAKIETAARFLNMHVQAGVPQENLNVAIVVHNAASKDILTNESYQARYKSDNPNSNLIKDLLGSGVRVIFCGQSSLSRGIPKEDLVPGVQLSLSAMTSLITLQDEGYRLIKF